LVYIKRLNDTEVVLGGPVATEEMIADGWFEYNGDVPQGNNFRLVKGVLEAFTPEVPELEQIVIHKEYLNNTDHKMYADYEPKDGEDLNAIKVQRSAARAYLREHERKNIGI
jgi:hypothetical protein